MKRLVALAVLLVPLWGCAQPAEAPATNATTNTNANATTMTTSSVPTTTVAETAITDQEKKVWDAIKAKDMDAFGALLAADSIYVSSDGVYDKPGTIAGLKEFSPTEVTLADWKVITIDKDAAVVTYTVTAKGTAGGQPLPLTPIRASSVWINRAGKWVAIFHQDCEVNTAAATPPAAANSSAKAANTNANSSATPTAAAAAAEAADPIAKEKQVWEELKRKDWDAFASDLAAEQIEVEPGGVYDKAGSIAGVKNVDFSKTTLSELKQMQIDADAAIVTYRIKDAVNKQDSRTSTVWIKRGDKWLALFHQRTPVIPAAAAKK